MSTRPKFYLPVVLPPIGVNNPSAHVQDVLTYYSVIAANGVHVTSHSGGSDGSLEISVSNPSETHPSASLAPSVAVSSVFAPTAGFVRFYPSAAVLPTPAHLPMAPPPDLITPDIGTLVIRVWALDYRDFVTPSSAASPRPNRIVLGWLQRSSIEAAFTVESRQHIKILQKSWEESGGSGNPAEAILAAKFLERFMKGEVEVFVAAGAELGSAALVTGPLAKVKLQTFFQPEDPQDPQGPTSPVQVEADDVIDNVAADALFGGHPLVEAANAPIQIKFSPTFTIWNDQTGAYDAFANRTVTLVEATHDIPLGSRTTDNSGQFAAALDVSLMTRDRILFRYATNGWELGNRTFTRDSETEPHLARLHLNANMENTREYRVGASIHPAYRDFVDELSANDDNEIFERDRGNSDKRDNSTHVIPVTYADVKSRLERILESERSYHETAPGKRFTVLVEGDSWLDYPPAFDDLYGHLDKTFTKNAAKAKAKMTYIRFPLQYHGDRLDQMVVGDAVDPTRQWHFTAEFLREYKVDLIVWSGGGNDLAEPGISHRLISPGGNASPIAAPYKTCFNGPFAKDGSGGYFDPALIDTNLTDDQRATALGLMDKSFAILLNNHPWHLYDRNTKTMRSQTPADTLYNELDAQLIVNCGERKLGDQRLNDIGKAVIKKFTLDHLYDLPDPGGDWRQRLLAWVFDHGRYRARFDAMLSHWRRLLTEAQKYGTFVITHTYCYPLFNQNPTNVVVVTASGPWFAPRFQQAKIKDLRIRCICMKTMIDNYRGHVLDKLKGEFEDTFDYVDVTDLNQDATDWADEMHLGTRGFRFVAEAIYKKVAAMPRFEKTFSP